MASTITTTGFDAAYPVAGQDNDSQGFRTNFTVTKTALEAARDEITALQTNTAKLNASIFPEHASPVEVPCPDIFTSK